MLCLGMDFRYPLLSTCTLFGIFIHEKFTRLSFLCMEKKRENVLREFCNFTQIKTKKEEGVYVDGPIKGSKFKFPSIILRG